MEKFVHQAPGQCLHGSCLLVRKRSQPRLHAPQLSLAQVFGLALEGHNHGSHVDRPLALVEAFHLGGNQCFGAAGFARPLGEVRGGY